VSLFNRINNMAHQNPSTAVQNPCSFCTTVHSFCTTVRLIPSFPCGRPAIRVDLRRRGNCGSGSVGADMILGQCEEQEDSTLTERPVLRQAPCVVQ
jgi:hypothetical protein